MTAFRVLSVSACLFVVLLGGLGGAGCQAPAGALSDSLAYVDIRGHTITEIEQAAREVFKKNGYLEGKKLGNELRFEKRSGRMSKLAYGGWFDEGVWVRVAVRTRPLDETTTVLECDAYRVRHYRDEFFEDTQKISRMQRGSYRDLLEEIKAALP